MTFSFKYDTAASVSAVTFSKSGFDPTLAVEGAACKETEEIERNRKEKEKEKRSVHWEEDRKCDAFAGNLEVGQNLDVIGPNGRPEGHLLPKGEIPLDQLGRFRLPMGQPICLQKQCKQGSPENHSVQLNHLLLKPRGGKRNPMD